MEGRQFMERKRISLAEQKGVLTKLFFSTLYLSAFTFGGGYVIVTLLKRKFVDEYHWIEEDEMLGAIAVNGAIVVGYKLAGLLGVVTAITATIIPPFVIISLISACYAAFRDNLIISLMLEGMQAGVGAVIASVVYEMAYVFYHGRDTASMILMAAAFVAGCVFGVNVVIVVLAAGAIGVVRTLSARRKEAVK